MRFTIQCLVLSVVWESTVNAGRILVWIPTPSISHQVVFRPLTQELAKRGHEVVVITTDPAFPKGKSLKNLLEIDVHDISYKVFRDNVLNAPKGNKDDFHKQYEVILTSIALSIDEQLNNTDVQNVIKGNKNFDLLLLEACCGRPTLALTNIFKAPVIQVSSFGALEHNLHTIGAPAHPFLYPTIFHQKINNLTIWDKIIILYNNFRTKLITNKVNDLEEHIVKKNFGNDVPSLNDLANNVDMLFLNIHPIFEGNHPVPPGVVYMWGMHKKPKKDLPKELKNYLDSSKKGIIYMSFGTNTDPTKLAPEMIQIFLKVFCQLPYNVLFKWNADELSGRCDNVRIAKWFPQSDLLRHPNIKLFITQGGMQSTDEAITAGVPLVGIPMLADQWYNVEKYVHLKIGKRLDADTLTEEVFRNTITSVIEDDSYRRNIRKLDELMRDEPMSGLERAVWWTEHVLRHGGARHLRAPAHNISWAEFIELQLIALILGVLFITVTVLIVIFYYLCNILTNFKKDKID